MSKVAILGGGASGIMAAITAARCGSKVVLLERNHRIGKKLLMTGNGRCNITNMNVGADSYNSAFVCDALKNFSVADTLDFFKKIGLLTYVEDEGRVYPVTNQASAVLDILRFELERRNIEIVCDFDTVKIEKNEKGFVITEKNGKKVTADRVVVALGGKSAPSTGSDGGGYRLLEMLGHSVKTPEKALVQLKTDKSIKGVRCLCKVSLNGKSETGEVQFTGYGLSGIPVLNLSKYAKDGDRITLDMIPDFTETELFEYLKKRDNQPLETYLVGMLNKPLGQMLLKECNIGKLTRESGSLEEFEIEKIAKKLKNWCFAVTGKMGWDNSQVTSGGIELLEVNPKTMESTLVKELYLSGEILDIDAPCGGFNLQWAWSSGYLAGKNAAGE
ncbi:MAG: NAD(P)/FAD-dependent oxidoreductase [Clostridia bacterium]|nr:NAD(P)/FAD-dependent oxidoreductase [Clostridia bacterium]